MTRDRRSFGRGTCRNGRGYVSGSRQGRGGRWVRQENLRSLPAPTRRGSNPKKIRSQKSGALFCHPSRSSLLRGHRNLSGNGAVLFLFLRRKGRTGFDHGEHAEVDAACADGDAACADGALREDLGCGPRREREVVGLLALAATRCMRLSACWRSPLLGA